MMVADFQDDRRSTDGEMGAERVYRGVCGVGGLWRFDTGAHDTDPAGDADVTRGAHRLGAGRRRAVDVAAADAHSEQHDHHRHRHPHL
jgi:hypothetical protein